MIKNKDSNSKADNKNMEVAVKTFMAGEVSILHEGIQNGDLP